MSFSNKNEALLIIDMINNFDFENGNILANKALRISRKIAAIKQQFNEGGKPVIFVNDHFNLWKADIGKLIDYCNNEKSKPVLDHLLPGDDDYFLIKPKHSAFFGTSLNTLLHHLNISNLILTGVAGNICVLFSANDAYMREYNLWVPNNCIASVDDDDNKYALKMMENVLKAKTESI